MTAILLQIFCWLQSFWYGLNNFAVNSFDSVLGVGDSLIGALDVSVLATPDFSSVSGYMWVAGATGLHLCLGIIVSAMILRFILQTIPFVRWGS